MKRIFTLLFVPFVLLCACQKPTEPQNGGEEVYQGIFETYWAGGLNGESNNNYESPWKAGSYTNEEAVQEKMIETLGGYYEATYKSSEIRKYNSYVTDYYETGNFVRFGFRADTGAMMYADFRHVDFFKTDPLLPQVESPREYAIEKATEIASEHVGVAEYELEVTVEDTPRNIDGIEYAWSQYYINFSKKVNGIKSSDFMTVGITSSGTVAFWIVGDLGAFDTFENADCTLNTIESNIDAVMQNVEKEKERERQAHEVEEHILALTPKGEYVVASMLSVTYRDAQTKKNYKGGVQIITKVGERAAE